MSHHLTPREEYLVKEYYNLCYGLLSMFANGDEDAKNRAAISATRYRSELVLKLNTEMPEKQRKQKKPLASE
jgi:hypothetical protein